MSEPAWEAVAVREKFTESWLDPRCSALVGWKVGQRLWARCRGKQGLFLTLTYKRDDYDDPQDLWHRARQEQHVALFFRRLSKHLHTNLKGRWCCKLEFQQGGWVHWHIILLDVNFIAHEDLARVWGHGFVHVKRMNEKNIRYMCKYVTKDGSLPAWLLFERPRAVKVMRVSPGFWGTTKPAPPRDLDYEKWGPAKPPAIPGYVPIGVKIARRNKTVVKTRRGTFRVDPTPAWLVLHMLAHGAIVGGRRKGWLWYRMRPQAWEAALDAATADRSEGAGRRGERRPVLHLRGTGNPDGVPIDAHTEAWLRESAELQHDLGEVFSAEFP